LSEPIRITDLERIPEDAKEDRSLALFQYERAFAALLRLARATYDKEHLCSPRVDCQDCDDRRSRVLSEHADALAAFDFRHCDFGDEDDVA